MRASVPVLPLRYEPALLRERQLAFVSVQASACTARVQGLLTRRGRFCTIASASWKCDQDECDETG